MHLSIPIRLIDLTKYYILFPSMEIMTKIYLGKCFSCVQWDIQYLILLEALVTVDENTLQHAIYDKYRFSLSFYLIFSIFVLLSILSLFNKAKRTSKLWICTVLNKRVKIHNFAFLKTKFFLATYTILYAVFPTLFCYANIIKPHFLLITSFVFKRNSFLSNLNFTIQVKIWTKLLVFLHYKYIILRESWF